MISEDEQCSLDVEIQSLKAIFAEELEVNRAEDEGGTVESLVVQMSPESSKGEKQQFVHFEIILEIPPEYPRTIPKITLRNVRGLSEEAQARTKDYMQHRAEELSGNAMLFELIQVAKEQLTSENTPSIPCSICLFSFDAEDSFSRTPCFHFFHTHCLAKHVQHTFAQKDVSEDKASPTETSKENQQEVLCPVCRLAIPFKESDPEQFPIPREAMKDQEETIMTPELREMQEKMAALYSEQLARGSIIDLEAEKNKFFIEISNTPDIPVLSSSSLSPSQAKQSNDTPATSDTSNTANSQEQHRKYYNPNSKRLVASNYDKRNPKMQARKQGSKADNTESNPWEEVDPPSIINFSQESDRPQRPYYKQYRRRDDQRFKDRTGDRKPTDENGDEVEGERNNPQFEKKTRPRNQYYDRNYKQNKNVEDENQATNKDTAVDESVNDKISEADAGSENRAFKKKKQRKPKYVESAVSNPEGNDEGTTEVNAQAPDEQFQKNTSGTTNNRKYNPRNTYGETRSYRQYNYNRGGKRFYTDRQHPHPSSWNDGDVKTNSTSENNVDNAEEQGSEFQPHSGRYGDNRTRNTNYRYKNMYSKNRFQDSRYKENWDKNDDRSGAADSVTNDNSENVEEPSNYSRYQNPRRNYQGGAYRKPRDRYGGRKQHFLHQQQDLETEENVTQKASESDGHDNQENKGSENVHTNRFQKGFSNESESSEALKETDISSSTEQTSNPRYKNYNSRYRQDTNLTDGSSAGYGKQFNKDNYRNQVKRRPKYGYNSNNDKEEADNEFSTSSRQENVESDQIAVDDLNRDVPSNKNWSDIRTNRRDNRNNNYAWKDRNRYQRYQGQHNRNTYPTKPDVSAMPSKPEPASFKQNIRPFTYNSATQDAQPVVSIPPPF